MPAITRRGTAVILVALQAQARLRAQALPDRPVRLIMPYGAGSEPDTLGRQLAQGMSPVLGQPVVVENRAGGSSIPVRANPASKKGLSSSCSGLWK